ncbi:MAG: SusC/RagA family TonB-linked outer membrane protein [Mangrovibacterium sp.]|nr:SusC/RagA family TonB-linked outer membrane protein [Mangrovibacterium sp.]
MVTVSQLWAAPDKGSSVPEAVNQQQVITGKVTDKTGTPIPGVSVSVKGTARGTLTDSNGNYSLSLTPDVKTLTFSFVGMVSREITVGDHKVINVTLEEYLTELDEVRVIGYGTLEKNRMTTSVSNIDKMALRNPAIANVGSALSGAIPGLRVTNTSGKPGSEPSFVLRGGTSWEGTGAPLFIIDGAVGTLEGLNADDIESLDVLKDAASTSIYGARAANGVVLITTKKGRPGDMEISYQYRHGVDVPRYGYDFVGAEDFLRIYRNAWKDFYQLTGRTNYLASIAKPSSAFGTEATIDQSNYTAMYLTPENEYLLNEGYKKMKDPLFGQTIGSYVFDKEYIIFQDNDMTRLFLKNGSVNDHHLSFRGGNDKATYALGLGYLDNRGIVLNAGYKRISANLNSDFRLTENIKLSSTVAYSNTNEDDTFVRSSGTIFQRLAAQPPTSRIYNNDGSFNPGLSTSFGNPLYWADKFTGQNVEQRLRTNVALDWSILPELSFTVAGSYSSTHIVDETFNKAYVTSGNLNTNRVAEADYRKSQTVQGNAILRYTKTFGNHGLSAMVGTEYYDYTYFNFNAATKFSPTDLIPTLNAGAERTSTSTTKTANRLVSVFGRINYDYKMKYLAQFNYRYDGSSKLANDKWGFFPGVSAGWNVHHEDFFKNTVISNYISSVKPRISYGVNGNVDNLGNFDVFGGYGLSPLYEGSRGYYNNSLPLLDLRWESMTTFDAGVDAGFFKDKVLIEADFYIRDVKDKISGYALPYYTGFTSLNTNIGTLRNKGFEIAVNADIVNQPQGLKWSVGVTASTNTSYVQKLPDNGLPKNRQGGTQIYDPSSKEVIWVGGLQEGERVGNDIVLGHIQEALYQSDEQLAEDADVYDAYHFAENAYTRYKGTVKWRDVDNNDTIDYRDRIRLGRTTPKWIGGITTNASYKGIGLYIRTDYATGHMIYNVNRVRYMGIYQGNENFPVEALDAWTPEHTDTDVPRIIYVDAFKDHGARGQEDRVNSRYQEKADYLCIREATLSYDFKKSVLPGFIKAARVHFTGSNLIYFTKYSGDSPELGGADEGRYPLPRNFTFGVNVNF